MKYSVGSKVVCKVETRPTGYKYVLNRIPDPKSALDVGEFEIIRYNKNTEVYTLLLPDDFNGWTIGKFMIEFQNIKPYLNGKKFWDVSEYDILEEETKIVSERKQRIKEEKSK